MKTSNMRKIRGISVLDVFTVYAACLVMGLDERLGVDAFQEHDQSRKVADGSTESLLRNCIMGQPISPLLHVMP